jgi:hypothetical protein
LPRRLIAAMGQSINIADVTRWLLELPDKHAREDLYGPACEKFPGLSRDELTYALRAATLELNSRTEELRSELARKKAEAELRRGLPADMPFIDVVRSRADEGNAFAVALLTKLESREYRIRTALLAAAAAVHPQCATAADGRSLVRDGRSLTLKEEDDLIDWFRLTRPLEARVIERDTG